MKKLLVMLALAGTVVHVFVRDLRQNIIVVCGSLGCWLQLLMDYNLAIESACAIFCAAVAGLGAYSKHRAGRNDRLK